MKAWIIFFLCASLILPTPRTYFASASTAKTAATGSKFVVDSHNAAALEQLQSQGAQKLADYGHFGLWQLPAGAPAAQGVVPVEDGILLRGITIDPLAPQAEPLLDGPALEPAGDQFWMVQFVGPVKEEWLAELSAAGLEPVAYVPNHAYVVWGRQPGRVLDHMLERQANPGPPFIQWDGPYHPQYRLSPDLRAGSAALQADVPVEVIVQFYTTPHLPASLERLNSLAGSQFGAPSSLIGFSSVRGTATLAQAAAIAAWPDVFNVERFYPPMLQDEAQGQIAAGNVTATGGVLAPSGPGYLDWLRSKGFPADPGAYPLVDIVDDGLDNGDAGDILHPDFYVLGSPAQEDRIAYITNCTAELTGASVGGHGNLNAGILAGYNDRSGFPYRDSQGYQLGLGISPFGSVAATKVFSNSGVFTMDKCGMENGDYTALVRQMYAAGARISSNSWGSAARGAYTAYSQAYDAVTRDASLLDGNQEMLHIFAAGNHGPGSGTINDPASAKNVLTVGASENVRDNGVWDRCYVSQASNANNIASFSSRGPTADRRMKPDLVAPGTHIQGPASQDPAFTGSAVCGSLVPYSKYYPSGQTRYTWSSGTSHSTPAVAGAAQLVYEYYGRVLKPGSTPSPAMLKALLLNAPRYLESASAGSVLPNPAQGWGSLHLGPLFDGTPRILIDQEIVFSATGQVYQLDAAVADSQRDLAVSLVWSDAPGNPAAGAAWVNDLDLEVLIDGKVYTGNAFQGAYSTPGSGYDPRNNVETIVLPAGQQGSFQVRVIARNIAGDGLPGNDDATDQDFALVISNGQASRVQFAAAIWEEHPENSNLNGLFEPGETLSLTYALYNRGGQAITGLRASLTERSDLAGALNDAQTLPDLAVGQALNSIEPLLVRLPQTLACGTQLNFQLELRADGGFRQTIPMAPFSIGTTVANRYQAAGLPANISERGSSGPGQVMVPLTLPDAYPLAGLIVRVSITHPHASDLVLSIISPAGTEVVLSQQNGGSGDDYQNTSFDDQESFSVMFGLAPFSGRFRPEQPLSVLLGQNTAGTWRLRVQDVAGEHGGYVESFGLVAQQAVCQSSLHHRIVLPLIYQ